MSEALEGTIVDTLIVGAGLSGIGSAVHLRQGLPDASVLVLQGIAFVLILASEALRDVNGKRFWQSFWHRLITPAGPASRVAIDNSGVSGVR